jgi:dienelactone hydrolase
MLEKIVYSSEPGIYVPSVLLLPKTTGTHPTVLFVNENGKAEPALVERYLEPLVKTGFVVFSIDPRGMGETDPQAPASSRPTDYKKLVHDAESGYFHDSIRVGKTVIGMRALDVMSGVSYLTSRPEVDSKRIAAAGHGMGGLIVLFAAAFDERISSVASNGALVSYSAIAESDLYSHRFGAFGPGFLTTFDLPDVASLVAPRLLVIYNSVDALHRVMDPETVKQAYGSTASEYSARGKPDRFSGMKPLRTKYRATIRPSSDEFPERMATGGEALDPGAQHVVRHGEVEVAHRTRRLRMSPGLQLLLIARDNGRKSVVLVGIRFGVLMDVEQARMIE